MEMEKSQNKQINDDSHSGDHSRLPEKELE